MKGKEGVAPMKKKKRIPWSLLYIAATIVAVVLFGVFNQEFGNVFATMAGLTPGWLSLAIIPISPPAPQGGSPCRQHTCAGTTSLWAFPLLCC